MLTYDAVVVGAGYVGCAIASTLAAAGVHTALLDRGPIPGGASRANYGNVQVQDAELDHSLPFVTAGRRRFPDLEKELGRSVGYRRVGSLLLIESESQWRLMEARIPRLRAAGIRAELVPAERLAELEPLIDRRAVLGACYHDDEGQVSPFAFMAAYLQCGRRQGLSLHPDCEVTGLEINGGRVQGVIARVEDPRKGDERFGANVVILTAGAWTPGLGRLLGRRWAARHVHGQALVTESSDQRLSNHLASAAFFESMHDGSDEVARDAVFAVSQTSEGHFLLGEAGVVTEDLGARSTWEGQAAIAREVSRFLPSLTRLRVLRGWAAPVAFTDDGRPLLGLVSGLEGLILATAFKSTVVVTPLVGSLVTQLVSTGRTDMDLTPFSPDRAIGHPGGSG